MDNKTLEKIILLVWLYFTIRILFVTYWDVLFLPPLLIILDSLFEGSKSDSQAQTEDTFQTTEKDSKNYKGVNKEQDENLTVKEIDSEKITSPAIEKIQELISDLQNLLKSDNKNGPSSPYSNKLTTKLENPAKKSIPTNKISAGSEEDNMEDSKTSPAIKKIQELIFDLQNSLK
ncbi:hypothetical protein TNCV_1017851 [Trichonephila clavipes]|uniref:Uncharacterized protein n=1 Tax=Trichonephila clavipes TaxID=2585209 RepID=A0A8X7BBI2_TRICX|nr:hypothetical protein TNCV_1017851 [Trichonephila clavipes]